MTRKTVADDSNVRASNSIDTLKAVPTSDVVQERLEDDTGAIEAAVDQLATVRDVVFADEPEFPQPLTLGPARGGHAVIVEGETCDEWLEAGVVCKAEDNR